MFRRAKITVAAAVVIAGLLSPSAIADAHAKDKVIKVIKVIKDIKDVKAESIKCKATKVCNRKIYSGTGYGCKYPRQF